MEFVALDLETSGLDSEKDRIIEVAFVKFENGAIKEKFQTLINPGVLVEKHILDLTGIAQKDLNQAVAFKELKLKIIEFVGDHPLVGHNLQFDLAFLKSHDLILKNKVYDTWHLSTLLLPFEKSHSLEILSKNFDLTHNDQHRALSDVLATISLFNLLRGVISELPVILTKKIVDLGSKSEWSLQDLFTETARKSFTPSANFKLKDYLDRKNISKKVTKTDSPQIAKEIQNKFNHKKNFVLEFPCVSDFDSGAVELLKLNLTDNSPFILIVPDYWYRDNFLNLSLDKTQLEKIQSITPSFLNVDWVKVENWLKGTVISPLYAGIIAKLWITEFYKNTKELSVLDLNLTFEECAIWSQFSTSFKKQSLNKNKNVFIVNQDVFLNDQKLRDQIFQTKFPVVIWKAGQLKDDLKYNSLFSITTEDIEILKSMGQELFDDSKTDSTIGEEIEKILQTLKNIDVRFALIFGMVAIFTKKKVGNNLFMDLILDDDISGDSEWQKIVFLSEKVLAELTDLKTNLNDISPSFTDKKIIFENFSRQIDKIYKVLKNFFGEQKDLYCFVKIQKDVVALNYIDQSKIEKIKLDFKKANDQLIFVDRNLTTNKTFANWNGFWNFSQKEFDFSSVVLKSSQEKMIPIKVVREAGYWNNPRLINQYKDILEQFIAEAKGDILVISNSFSAVQKFSLHFKDFLTEAGYSVFAQGNSGGRAKTSEKLKESPKNVLIGTYNFLKYIEVNPFDRLLILKLPFKHPNDPLIRFEEKNESQHQTVQDRAEIFQKTLLPKAIIEFKNGLALALENNMIDQEVMVWDSKLMNSAYAKDFQDSLPQCFDVSEGLF